jgi:hypothetical protein
MFDGKSSVQELPSAWDSPPVDEVVKLTEYAERAPAAAETPVWETDTLVTPVRVDASDTVVGTKTTVTRAAATSPTVVSFMRPPKLGRLPCPCVSFIAPPIPN